MREITTGELSKILVEHKRWIDTDEKEGQCADLSNAKLCEANLRNVHLCDANLRNVCLCNADLQGADFFRADLSGANLSGANLSGASLSGAIMKGVKGLTNKYAKVATYREEVFSREEVINREEVIKDSFIQKGVSCLWHLTHKDNIQSILEHGILNHDDARGLFVKPVDISDRDVQECREMTEEYYHRKIHEYAPLYIKPRNPMLYSIHNKQSELCLIEVSLSVMFESEYLITDGNAASVKTQIFKSVKDINELPWDVLNSRYWDDHDEGKRKMCAEVLIYPQVKLKHIGVIHCSSKTTLNTLENCGHEVKLSDNLFF